MNEPDLIPTSLPVLATIRCPFCDVVVPDGRYCGACGAHLAQRHHRASQRLHS